MSLKDLLLDDGTTLADVADYLDALPSESRIEEVLACSRKEQIAMWNKAAAAEPIGVDHFVPPGTPPLTEVIHHGRNSLPAFRRFQKRFAVQHAGATEAIGYNEGATRSLIGPGYFVAEATGDNPDWADRGAFYVNYFRVPDGEVVPGWPRVVPNSRGIQFFVYNKTRDFMRKVSDHVSIGSAYKDSGPMGAYFVLVREDEA